MSFQKQNVSENILKAKYIQRFLSFFVFPKLGKFQLVSETLQHCPFCRSSLIKHDDVTINLLSVLPCQRV